MTMLDEVELRSMLGHDVVDESGKSVGNIEYIFNDEETGRAEWIGLLSGTIRPHRLLVPVRGAERDGVSLRVPWPKERIKQAPTYEQDRRGILGLGQYKTTISKEKERIAYAHYGLEELAGTGAGS